MITQVQPAPATPARVVFVDVARIAATVMMVQGHTVDALLSPAYRDTPAFSTWTSIRGLTPTTFLFLAGFAFAIVTWRQTATADRGASARRVRRFGLMLLLGYALHAPAGNLMQWLTIDAPAWRAFLAVDILQCIAVTLALLQLLAWWAGTATRFGIVAAAMAIFIPLAAPWAWSSADPLRVSLLSAYVSPAGGSLFPLLPWSAYAALGAAMGAQYRAGGERTSAWVRHVLLPVGLSLFVGGTLVRAIHSQGLAPQPADFWRQAGCGCLVLTACAMMSARIRRLPHALGIIAGESLTVYCLHLAIVYGSPWNAGLRQLIGPTLDLRSVIAVVLLMWSTMAVLVIGWGVCKRQHPIVAARIRYVVAASLALGLLL